MHELFEAFGVEWKLLIAQAVNFAIVLLGLRYFLYRPVMKVIDDRRRMVEKGVHDAQLAEEKLATAESDAGLLLKEAGAKAEEVVALARESAGATRAQLVQEAEQRAQRIEQEALERAAQESAKLRRESEKDIARLAILAAEKALQRHD